jgi:ubiquinone/menaquinone biosynthesis C-methylase UbiE
MKFNLLSKLNYTHPVAYELLDIVGHFPDIYMRRFNKVNIITGDGIILELGCGTGRSSYIYKGLEGVKVINLDINKAFVSYGYKKGRFINPVVGSAYQLSFHDNIFDKIVIPDAFHHILEHELLFNECRRVLKPGGELIIFEVVMVMEKKVTNTIINHYADGVIWNLNVEGFRQKINRLGSEFGFQRLVFHITKRENTIMGLTGGIDVLVKLVKK